jgi:hypothetical protein
MDSGTCIYINHLPKRHSCNHITHLRCINHLLAVPPPPRTTLSKRGHTTYTVHTQIWIHNKVLHRASFTTSIRGTTRPLFGIIIQGSSPHASAILPASESEIIVYHVTRHWLALQCSIGTALYVPVRYVYDVLGLMDEHVVVPVICTH